MSSVRLVGRIIAFPAVALLLAAATTAQITGSSGGLPSSRVPAPVYGQVRTQDGNVEMRSVKVEIWSIGGTPVDTLFTDSKGSFMSLSLAPGAYVVSIKVEGYEEYKEQIEIMGRPGIQLYPMLRKVADTKPAVPGTIVSTRELSLPQRAQEELHKGQDSLFQKHNPADSLVNFQRVIEMAPDFYEAYYYAGVAQMKMGHWPEAEAAYRKSLSMSDDHFAEACFSLASMFDDLGRFKDAEPFARQGLLIQAEAWRGFFELSRALFGEGRIVDAEQSAMEAQKRQPRAARIYVLLANIHLKLNKNEAVLDDLNNYLRLDPTGQYSEQVKQLKEKTEQALGRTATVPPTQE